MLQLQEMSKAKEDWCRLSWSTLADCSPTHVKNVGNIYIQELENKIKNLHTVIDKLIEVKSTFHEVVSFLDGIDLSETDNS